MSFGERKLDEDLAPEDEADAYLSVTDSFCVTPPGKQFCWIPWNEGRQPTAELYYACNKVLNWWTHYMKLKNIQVFCDGGSHRSVTVFGAFLLTYFKREEYEKIVQERTPIKQGWDPTKVDITKICHPLEYIESYLDEIPSDRLLFNAMGKDYLGRLEGHCQDIYRTVKERYADNKGADV